MGKRGVIIGMFWIALVFTITPALTQSPTVSVRVDVLDDQTEQPLPYATVMLINGADTIGLATDSLGVAFWEAVPTGYYTLEASYVGFEPFIQGNILLQAGRPRRIKARLKVQNLPDISVVGDLPDLVLNPLSTIQLTVEQALRFPATFQDPARLAASFPGVVVQNDQGNNLIIRGNSPIFNHWRLEGLEITNPNHTPNAGNLSDRVTQAGGGVNMLSTQVLANSRLFKGAYPAFYDNAVGGVLDMYFRAGATDKTHYTLQAGLIGLEASVEGPFRKGKEASYLLNYRYSTIGLLSGLGLELGDEDIQFQDLSFHVHLPLDERTDLRLFGIWGRSSNVFLPRADSLWQELSDRVEVQFLSQQATGGFVLERDLGTRLDWTFRGLISDWEADRSTRLTDASGNATDLEKDAFRQTQATANSQWDLAWGRSNVLSVGLTGIWRQYDQQRVQEMPRLPLNLASDITVWEGQLYAQTQWRLRPGWVLELGSSLLWQNEIGSLAWQPMGTLYWLPSSRWRWQMSYRKQAQSPPLGLLAEVDADGVALNPDLDWIRAHLVSGGFQSRLGKRWVLESELYQQWLRDVPVEVASSAFSAVNMVQTYRTELSPLMSAGESENRGIELNLRTRSFEGWYTNLSGTLYQSVYRGSDGLERSTAFDGRFLGHATVGRSFRFSKHPNRTLEGHISSLFRGGLRYRVIDQDASREQGTTIFVEGGLTEQLPAYFRVDTRLIYRWEKPNRTNALFLDIQNASNQQNTAFFYYDPEQDVILEQRQLGLIPILSYRLSW